MVVADWSESNKKKIALFVGADVVAHSLLNEVIDDMKSRGYEPVIFLPEHRIPTNKPNALQTELREAALYERYLTNNIIYPFMDAHIYAPYNAAETPEKKAEAEAQFPLVLSPDMLAKTHNLRTPQTVSNVNSPEFINKLCDEDNLVGMISIRCFQIFSKDFIKAFGESKEGKKRFLFNIHPGQLPDFKGVLSMARAMESFSDAVGTDRKSTNGQKLPGRGWTLHEIDSGIDTGSILWTSLRHVDLSMSVLANSLSTITLGANSISRALEELDAGNILSGVSQGAHRGIGYYTYPTPKRLEIWKEKGIQLIDQDRDKKSIVDIFGPKAGKFKPALTKEVERAIEYWRKENELPSLDNTDCKRYISTRGKRAASLHATSGLNGGMLLQHDAPDAAFK